jgi:hypothetical protein
MSHLGAPVPRDSVRHINDHRALAPPRYLTHMSIGDRPRVWYENLVHVVHVVEQDQPEQP